MTEEKKYPNFNKLWTLKCNNTTRFTSPEKELKSWYDYEIYAKVNKDVEMSVWNQRHPVDENCTNHICKAGTKVRIWMVSRFGDAGITDNLINPVGYHTRGIEVDDDLYDIELYHIKDKTVTKIEDFNC